MNLCSLSIALLFPCFLITFTAGSDNPTNFTGDVFVNCGSIGTSTAQNGRDWLGDIQPKLSSLLQIHGLSTISTVIHKLDSAGAVPHKTARISRSRFSYAFQVNPGQKIIRLHFNPATYRGFKGLKDLFTVEAGLFTLLSNFSASITARALGVNTFAKVFCLNIEEDQQLTITFSPESSQSVDTYAFINGIEIIYVPSSLSYFHGGHIALLMAGQKRLAPVDNSTALEIIQRINIEKDPVPSARDFVDVSLKWATQKADKIKTKTWKIPVDVGFRYLIRVHFSRLGVKASETGDVMFRVLINEMIAQTSSSTDIVKARDGDKILLYRDYMVMMKGLNGDGKVDLSISLQLYNELVDGHGALAGFEIVKLSNAINSLAGPNPEPPARDSPHQTIRILLTILRHRNAGVTIAIAIICLVNIVAPKLREVWEASSTEEKNKPSGKVRQFLLAEIKSTTDYFSDERLIGSGGFGKVYKGRIDEGQKTVAIKRLDLNSEQGGREFKTEIETLSKIQHCNVVPLIGYCNEDSEMILVYDYMAKGTLADHIYERSRERNNFSPLTWKQRLTICVGAARGLNYVHTNHVIHRDIKASNILLDEQLIAKVSDFGLAKAEDESNLHSHVSTVPKGTPGHCDPSYWRTWQLRRTSDTFSFGMMLLEVLCGRPAVDLRAEEDEEHLLSWVKDKKSKGEVNQIVDPTLREEISPNSLDTFVWIAERCLNDEAKNRPAMSLVVLELEFALVQQENNQNLVLDEIESNVSDDICSSNDEIDLSDNSWQPARDSTSVSPRQRHSPRKLSNRKTCNAGSYVRKKERKAKWWASLWNRGKRSSERKDLLRIGDEAYRELAKFDWKEIEAATSCFSSSNIIARGFGEVYKAVLPTGQVFAVKMYSLEGLEYFKKEILLLPKLQHPNIIKLLGYCTHRKAAKYKLLVHEFTENKSLADILRDENQRQRLQWAERFKIIMGIARGLFYLHNFSGVAHGDFRSSKILLDTEMNPKISDFGFAMTLRADKWEIPVEGRSPLLASDRESIYSDVYGLGIVVLEIVSGRMVNTNSEEPTPLVGVAWNLWNEGKAQDLADDSLPGIVPEDEVLRCIQVALLCTQCLQPKLCSILKVLEGSKEPREPRDPWLPTPRQNSARSTEYSDELDSNAAFDYDDILGR